MYKVALHILRTHFGVLDELVQQSQKTSLIFTPRMPLEAGVLGQRIWVKRRMAEPTQFFCWSPAADSENWLPLTTFGDGACVEMRLQDGSVSPGNPAGPSLSL